MKKKLAGVLLVTAIAAQSMTLFAGSTGSNDYEPSYTAPEKPSTVVTVGDSGVKTTGEVTSTTTGGSSIAIVVDTKTESGAQITVNAKGEAVVGDQAVSFAKGEAATAGLPIQTVEEIGKINSGAQLSGFIRGYDLTGYNIINNGRMQNLDKAPKLDLTGYNALTGTHAVVTKDAKNGKVNDKPTETVVYVPNLVEGLQEVSVLYYDNASGRWLLLPVNKYDAKSKLVYVSVPGSGTLSVVYKK